MELLGSRPKQDIGQRGVFGLSPLQRADVAFVTTIAARP